MNTEYSLFNKTHYTHEATGFRQAHGRVFQCLAHRDLVPENSLLRRGKQTKKETNKQNPLQFTTSHKNALQANN